MLRKYNAASVRVDGDLLCYVRAGHCLKVESMHHAVASNGMHNNCIVRPLHWQKNTLNLITGPLRTIG